MTTTQGSQTSHIQAQLEQCYDLIDGGVCFVLADGTERIAFANTYMASLYGCENVQDFLHLCSSSYRNMMEAEDYTPLAEISAADTEHITMAFHYRTKQKHLRMAQGLGALKDTPFGRAYVLMVFSADEISSELKGKDITGVLGMHDFFEEALRQAQDRLAHPRVRALCAVCFDLTNFAEYNRLYGTHREMSA